jgi:hypothetical protein
MAETTPVHGDLVYFEAFYRDFFVLHHPLSLFHFTEATFIFPDFLAMTVIRSVVRNGLWAILVYEFLIVLSLALILGKLFRRVWGADASSSWTFALGFAVVLFLMATTPNYVYMALPPENHGAIQLLFLLWLYQLGDLSGGDDSRLVGWLCFDLVTSAGFAFSDLLALPSAVIPGVIMLGWLSLEGATSFRRTLVPVLSVSAVGVAGGMLAKATLIRLGILNAASAPLLGPGWGHRLWSAVMLVPSLAQLVGRNWILYLTVALGLLAYLWRMRTPRGLRVDAHPEAKRWLGLFSRFSAVVLVVKMTAVVATGRWADLYSMRYLQEVFYIPLVWLVLWAIPELRLSVSVSRLSLASVLALSLGILITLPHRFTLLRPQELTRCLDAHVDELPTPWGFADFWVARLVTFTSRERIQVNQVKLNTSVYNWESSPLWYREDLYGRRIDRTTFFIPSRPGEREAALAHWGRPTNSFECPSRWGDLDVMLYPNGIEAAPEDRSRPN